MRIGVLDTDIFSREGLESFLARFFPAEDFIFFESFPAFEKYLEKERAMDCLLYSTVYPLLENFKDMNRLAAMASELHFVVIAPSMEKDFRQQAILSGANGFIYRDNTVEALETALKAIFSGRSHYDKAALGSQKPNTFSRLRMDRLDRLTARQKQVLVLLGRGYTNREIADELEIALNTVRIHVASVLKLLNLKNRTEAAILVTQLLDAGHALG